MGVLIALTMIAFAAPAQSAPPPDVRAACDNVLAIVSKTQGTKTRRSTGSFKDEMFRAAIPGCRIQVDGSFKKAAKSGAAADNLATALGESGWTELPDFSSDGHDGTSFAYRKDAVACFARGEWDGGSDDEPETPAADPYKVTIICGRAAAFVRPE